MAGEQTLERDSEKVLSPSEKEKLLKELKERLKEIERLRAELGMKTEEKLMSASSESKKDTSENDSVSSPVSIGRVREEVEELRVPALEMLDDKPLIKKKKEGTLT